MADPRVTILTPTYNHAAYIGACAQSVLAQTYGDWEMLILDDGSCDATPEIAASFRDPRIRVLRLAHRGIEGLAEIYNEGLDKARGDLVAILEGDDLWVEGKLATQVEDFIDPAVVLSAGRFEVLAEAAPYVAPETLPPTDALTNTPVGRASFHMLHHDILTFTFPVTVTMRRHALVRIGGFQSHPGLPVVDMPTFLRLGLEGPWRFHSDVLGRWRRHSASTTGSRFPDILSGCYALATAFYRQHRDALPCAPEEVMALDRRWAGAQRERLVVLARALARDGRRREAAEVLGCAREFPLGRRARLILSAARAAYRIGLSAEWIFRVAGRPRWQGIEGTRGGDPVVRLDTRPEDLPYLPFA